MLTQAKIFNKKTDKIHNLNHFLMNFLLALETKDFSLTDKQLYHIFVYKENYKCKRKEFLKVLLSLVKEGFVRRLKRKDIVYYEFNKTRYEMEQVLRKMQYQ